MSDSIESLQSSIALALSTLRKLEREGTLPGTMTPLLHLLPPEGMAIEITLRNEGERKIRKDASAKHWNPQTGSVVLTYRKEASRSEPVAAPASDRDARLCHLVQTLDAAERNPRWHFVALKLLRDRLLERHDLAWTLDVEERQQCIEDAIREGMVTTSKMPNPKSPQFPVTAVRLVRQHSMVREILESLDQQDEFAPLPIRGEPLSKTIRDQRR